MVKIIAISNTGPLISAFQCKAIHLLTHYFSKLYITHSEWDELKKHGWSKDINKWIQEEWINVIKDLQPMEIQLAMKTASKIASFSSGLKNKWQDHLPEAEAMAIMRSRIEYKIDILLLDEKAARQIARQMGLRITGFPGILARAGMDGIMSGEEIRKLLKSCQRQGTHYSDELIDTVVHTYGS